jgi:hypothetical protein
MKIIYAGDASIYKEKSVMKQMVKDAKKIGINRLTNLVTFYKPEDLKTVQQAQKENS